jgi:nucleoside-diphosphate-sugar epimerase
MHRAAAWATNDRLRDEATRTLVDAALAADVEAVVFPSITFNYADGGDSWLDEDAPLDPPFAPTRSALAAEGHLARFTSAGRRGVVLRLARLYGPGRASAEVAAMARHGRMIVIGRGANLVSSLHVEDAGSALAAGIRPAQASRIAAISISRTTLSETSTPPASSAAFQLTPQSLRSISSWPSNAIRWLSHGSVAAPR